jgi:hypothetical protein
MPMPMPMPERAKRRTAAWSEAELARLKSAVEAHTHVCAISNEHKRDWLAISNEVGTGKTAKQCRKKAHRAECASAAGPPLRARSVAWTDAESLKLKVAVALYGRDWASVSRAVVSKTPLQCSDKLRDEVSAGRLEEPPKKQVHVFWTPEEQQKLHAAVGLLGRDWVAVADAVNSGKTRVQCMSKALHAIASGHIPDPGAKVSRFAWTEAEVARLKDAVARHKRNFVAIAKEVGTRTRQQCNDKVKVEIQAGRLHLSLAQSMSPRKGTS